MNFTVFLKIINILETIRDRSPLYLLKSPGLQSEGRKKTYLALDRYLKRRLGY